MRSEYSGSRSDGQYQDLWHAATAIDYRLAQETSEAGILRALASDDAMELWLRRFSSYVYYKRTGDKAGAMHMLAVAAPGGGTDLAPQWLVSETSAYAISENKIRTTANAASASEARYKGGDAQWRWQGADRENTGCGVAGVQYSSVWQHLAL